MFRIPIAPQFALRLVTCSALVGVFSVALAAHGLARPLPSPAPQSQTWDPLFADGETNGMIRAYAYYNGQLYAGGDFTVIDGTPAQYVARWRGSSWEALAGVQQLPNPVTALAVYNGVLYAGGIFQPWNPGACGQSSPGGMGPGCIDAVVQSHLLASYGSAGWTLDSTVAFAAAVRDLEVFNDGVHGPALYVGGHIVSVGQVDDSQHLLRYTAVGTGTSAVGAWSGVGYGVDPDYDPASPSNGVYDLLSVKSETLTGFAHDVLCVAGKFEHVNSQLYTPGTRNIAHWSRLGWRDIGCGMQSPGSDVPPAGTALAVFGQELYLGGKFQDIGCGVNAVRGVRNLAVWNGATWREVGGLPNVVDDHGVNDEVSSLAVQGSPATLIIGGYFESAGKLTTKGIALWNGTTFLPVGRGVDSDIVVEVHRSPVGISVGGQFEKVYNTNGHPVVSNNAARWRP